MSDTVLLVDAYSLIYRAFFAIRSLTGPDGKPVNAIFGFVRMLRKILSTHHPAYGSVVFDLGPPEKRLALLPAYKAQRPPTPADLESQLPAIRTVIEAMRIPISELAGEEADDIIATLAVRAAQAHANVLIVSNDKDFLQIVGPHIRAIRADAKDATLMDAAGVRTRYGIPPEQMVDLLSLTGDAVDNIPGVPGIGEKTAAALLQKHGNVDSLLAHAAELPQPRLREALLAHADRVRTNRQLIALRRDLELPVSWQALRIQAPDYGQLQALFAGFGFKSLLAEINREAASTGDLFGHY